MFRKWLFRLRVISKLLSIRATLFALLAIISSLAAILFADLVPDEFADLAGGDAVDDILRMMASSMLLVVTFSLSTMVAAYNSATQNATPQATSLIKDDSESLSAISIFLGAFIYAVVSLVAVSTDYYGEKGRVILLLLTVFVLVSVVIVIIRWVEHLKNMGSVLETIKRVEDVTRDALLERARRPTFGCRVMEKIPRGLSPVVTSEVGFIQNIDISNLSDICEEYSVELYIVQDIGSFIHDKSIVGYVTFMDEALLAEFKEKVKKTFSVDTRRTFDNDPLYGVSTLAGIGIKAMSPSLNDPATATDVISSLVRILLQWNREKKQQEDSSCEYQKVYFPQLRVEQLINTSFYHLAKDVVRSIQASQMLRSGLEILAQQEGEEFKEAIDYQQRIFLQRFKVENKFNLDFDEVMSASSPAVLKD